MEAALLLLGVALGLVGASRGWAVVYFAATFLASFFVGGIVTGRFTAQRRGGAFTQGIATWALAVVIAGGALTLSLAGQLGAVAGLAGTGAGAAAAAAAIYDEIAKLHPRIVSDMSVLKGKIVTRVITDHDPEHAKIAAALARQAPREVNAAEKSPPVKAETRKAALQIGRAGRIAAALGFLAILGAFVATVLGAMTGSRRGFASGRRDEAGTTASRAA